MPETTGLLKTREAAELLGVHPSTLEHWRSTGRGPRYIQMTQRSVRYDRADLFAWLRAQKVTPGT